MSIVNRFILISISYLASIDQPIDVRASSRPIAAPWSSREADRDKTGTNAMSIKAKHSQMPEKKPKAVGLQNEAEGTRLELATGFPAPHFQCGR